MVVSTSWFNEARGRFLERYGDTSEWDPDKVVETFAEDYLLPQIKKDFRGRKNLEEKYVTLLREAIDGNFRGAEELKWWGKSLTDEPSLDSYGYQILNQITNSFAKTKGKDLAVNNNYAAEIQLGDDKYLVMVGNTKSGQRLSTVQEILKLKNFKYSKAYANGFFGDADYSFYALEESEAENPTELRMDPETYMVAGDDGSLTAILMMSEKLLGKGPVRVGKYTVELDSENTPVIRY